MSRRPSPPASTAGQGNVSARAGEQKRAAVRLRLPSLAAEVWRLDERLCRLIACKLINISEGGALIEAETAIDEGATMFCRFSLPKGPQVANPALVVRAEPLPRGQISVGLRFVGMPIARRDLLVRWIFAELAARSR